MQVTIDEILGCLCGHNIKFVYSGETELTVNGYSSLKNLKNGCMCWARSQINIDSSQVNASDGILLLMTETVSVGPNVNRIVTDDPHKAFFILIKHFWDTENDPYIAPTAIIETQNICSNLSVGQYSYIGEDVQIGEHVKIGHHVVLEGRVSVGEYTNIESGTKIGVCGFGHYSDNSINIRVPHLGGVQIGKHVNIGANCTIARGTIDDTIIGNYVKIDNLCHIAHNDIIMDNVLIAGGAMIGGSTTIEEGAWLSSCTICNSLVIGKGAFIGVGSVVTKDIPANQAAFGVPAKAIKDAPNPKRW